VARCLCNAARREAPSRWGPNERFTLRSQFSGSWPKEPVVTFAIAAHSSYHGQPTDANCPFKPASADTLEVGGAAVDTLASVVEDAHVEDSVHPELGQSLPQPGE
jgi:hypothetical protein